MTRKRIPTPAKSTILIATANPAVAAYFSRVRKDCRYVNMTVECLNATTLEGLIKATGKARIAGKFASAWAIFGLDDFGIKPEDITAAKPLAEARKVKLGWNLPGFSMWLYIHLKPLNQYISDAASFDQALAKVFPGFKLTADYMTNEGQDIHLRLFSSFSKAINNTNVYNKISEKVNGIPATTFPLLYEDIKNICGEADLSHNQKLLAK
ncbi:MAG: RloB domain-containing protein [Spirochaetales bacterium]|nr:RloB domain-containing protein [Spirochaetales bacterium]